MRQTIIKISAFCCLIFVDKISIAQLNNTLVSSPFNTTCTAPAGQQSSVIDASVNTNRKLGHMVSSPLGGSIGAWSQYSGLGFNNIGEEPVNNNQYGLFTSWRTDKAFFGIRAMEQPFNVVNCTPTGGTPGTDGGNTQTMIGWGNDDNDPLVFEYSSWDHLVRRQTQLNMPDGTVGIGQNNIWPGGAIPGTFPYHTGLGLGNRAAHLHVYGRGYQTSLTESVNESGGSAGFDVRLANAANQDQFNTYMMRKFNWADVGNFIPSVSQLGLNVLYATSVNNRPSGSLLLGVQGSAPIHFATTGIERMRITPGGFAGIGGDYSVIQPKRRLDVMDATNAQLRLSFSQGTTAAAGNGIFTDFRTTSLGDLEIYPMNNFPNLRNVGIGSPSPSERIDVNGNARLRLVPSTNFNYLMTGRIVPGGAGTDDISFSKLAMSTNATDVLHGDGTWGPVSATINADNGCTTNGSVVELGRKCGSTGGELIHQTEVPLNNFNLVFTDGDLRDPVTQGMDRIGIGTSCMPQAKLDVVRNYEDRGPYDLVNKSISGINLDQALPDGYAIGVYGEANNQYNNFNIGGDFIGTTATDVSTGVRAQAQGSYHNWGVHARTSDISGVPFENVGGYFETEFSPRAIGVKAVAAYGDNNFGGQFTSQYSQTGDNNIGVMASVYPFWSGSGGVNNWAGYFNGDVFSTGSYLPSDARLKKDIKDFSGGLDLINKLNPKEYEYNQIKNVNLPQGQHIGLIAQEVKDVLPNATKEFAIYNEETKKFSDEKYLSVNYSELIPVLIQGMKEQQTEIETLKAKLSNLEKCCSISEQPIVSSSSQAINQMNVVLSNSQVAVLSQNVPNPFSEHSSIGYFIPEESRSSEIIFSTIEGVVLNKVELLNKGKGILNVYGSDLSNGTYTYTLLIDGKIFETKRMTLLK